LVQYGDGTVRAWYYGMVRVLHGVYCMACTAWRVLHGVAWCHGA
jgi:hypothetical protein